VPRELGEDGRHRLSHGVLVEAVEIAGSIAPVDWVFEGEIIEWRGPAPYFFVAMSESDSAELKEEARSLIYWGQVPVLVVIGATEFNTALFPREGRYLVPLKGVVRKAEGLGEGDVVTVELRPAWPPEAHE
jgi:hypothetical protein